MYATRRTIRTISATGFATLAALAAVSAPGASGLPAQARPFLTGDLARAHPIRVVDRLDEISSARGPVGQKLSPELAALARADVPQLGVRPATFRLKTSGNVRVVVETRRPASARAAVARLGGRVERTTRGFVQALVPRNRLAALSTQASVELVRAPFRPVEHAIAGEQVATTLARAWHESGLTGKGVKVAIVDGGFAGLAERQAAGELPANLVTADFCGGRLAVESDHGTAVAEIVHEMAPEAELLLVCVGTELDLAAAVSYLKSQGVRIVNHSMGWFGPSRGDGTGYIGALVADARASGILWVNSAGNEAETHWSGTFSGAGDDVHDWAANGDEGNSLFWPNDSVICGLLKWDEWPAAVSDFDLALVDAETSTLIDISDGYQTGSQPPLEEVCVEQTTGRDLVVFWAIVAYDVTTSPRLDLFSYSPPLEYQTAAGSIVDPATSSAALAVGALCWQSRQLEPYSSQGPTIDGRMKPDLVGHDSVSGATYGPFTSCPSAFAGTSASSPEVAGAAALVKQAYPAYAPGALQQYLVRSARDLLAPGPDSVTGAGELQMPKLPDLEAPSVKSMPGSGRAGTRIRLVSRVSDDSGEFRVVARVKRQGRVVATLRKKFVSASGPATVAFTWKAPPNGKGTYRQCVAATDRAGNASPLSCARVVVR